MADSDGYRVPTPRPPDDGEAWYAPEILAQRSVHPGSVAMVREGDGRLRYGVREPGFPVVVGSRRSRRRDGLPAIGGLDRHGLGSERRRERPRPARADARDGEP